MTVIIMCWTNNGILAGEFGLYCWYNVILNVQFTSIWFVYCLQIYQFCTENILLEMERGSYLVLVLFCMFIDRYLGKLYYQILET